VTSATDLHEYSGVRVVVLGASGFIGRWVSRSLGEAGADLHAIVRNRLGAQRLFAAYGVDAEVHEANLTDLEGAQALLKRLGPAAVFNLSGYGVDPGEKTAASERLAGILNVDLPGAIAETLATIPAGSWGGRRVIHAGSVFEYGDIGGHLEETAAANPTGLYGCSKLAGTHRLTAVCQATGLSGLTARLCQVYGPGEHPGRLLPDLIDARQHALPLSLTVGTQRKDFTYVADVAEGLLRLGVTAGTPGEIVNVATGRLTTVREFAEAAAHLLRLDPSRLKFEKPLPDNELQHLEVAITRLRELTCWEPVTDVAEGLCRTIDFLERTSNG
jgi:nucleoside-diphosphate-sugar epimerase